MLRSRVMPSFAYLIAAFSEECVEKLVHGVLLLYLVVSFAIGSCKSEKRAASSSHSFRLGILASIVFNNGAIMADHYSLVKFVCSLFCMH